jgi:hypothetical protein
MQSSVLPLPQALSQQTPSTHDPLWHWPARSQTVPLTWLTAQRPLAAQNAPAWQAVSARHGEAHTAPAHPGRQKLLVAAGQVALVPSHSDASVATSEVQLGSLHCAPGLPAGCWQVPARHTSSVHGFGSLEQATPSVRAAGAEQLPLVGSQMPMMWHSSGAGHTTALPAAQTPAS